MNRELIDRNQIRYLQVEIEDGTKPEGVTLRSIIDKMATVDAVEVVRCGDCKNFKEYPVRGTDNPSGWGKCKKINMDIDLTINDFCSYGERRPENENT